MLIALAGLPPAAQATTIWVDTIADGFVDGSCTMRAAMLAASTRTAVTGCAAGSGDDTIRFRVSGTIFLSQGIPSVGASSALTVDGAGHQITLDGRTNLFIVPPSATLRVNALTIANAEIGIVNLGVLVATNATFVGSTHSGVYDAEGVTTIINSTFVGNRRGVFLNGPGTVTYTSFSGNETALSLYLPDASPPPTMGNNIFANNGSACELISGVAFGISGPNVDYGNTHAGTCGPDFDASAIRADPLLGRLADNGGSTPTLALLPGSPAIDAAAGACPATDQRGQPRPADGDDDGEAVCDIGAYEYASVFDFSGFFAPVENLPVLNTARAGAAIPMKFSLAGDQGLDILASGSPRVQPVSCPTSEPQAAVQETVSAGATGLSYDTATDTYTYVWKTNKAWAGTCRQFVLQLTDGQVHVATFAFR